MKILKLFLALLIAGIAIFPPIQLLWNTHILSKVSVYTYEKAHKWRYDHGNVDMYPGCAYAFPSSSGAYIGYCLDETKDQSTNDLNTIPLDIPINVPKSFISELLHIPNSPLDQNVCFDANNYFKGLPANKLKVETRIFLYPKPIKELKEVDASKIIMETFLSTKCIKVMSGMTLIGVGNGSATFFDKPFLDGLEKTAQFNLPTITTSGGNLYSDKKQLEKRIVKKTDKYELVETEIPLDSYEFSVISHIDVYTKTPFGEIIVAFVAVYSVWLLALKTLIENAQKLLQEFFKIVLDGFKEIVVLFKLFIKKIQNALQKMSMRIKILTLKRKKQKNK